MTDRGPYIQTYSGGRAYLLDPRPEDIRLIDIAHGLSQICRFGGHTKHHYSVAQHSVLVSYIVTDETDEQLNSFIGLLHDASEAYVGDVVSPLKGVLPGFKEIEAKWFQAIGEAFGIGNMLALPPAAVKEADLKALSIEAHTVLLGGPHAWTERPSLEMGFNPEILASFLEIVTPQVAEERYVEAFRVVSGART